MSIVEKVAILYSGLSGYSAACQKALRSLYGVKLMVVHWPISSEAPFQEEIYGHIDERIEKKGLTKFQILEKVSHFQPQAIIISGWMDKDYLFVAKRMKQKGVPIIAGSDTQFNGSLRQLIAKYISRWYLHPSIDIMWVTGERQKQLAHHLGYRGVHVWTGFYACDWSKFSQGTFQERTSLSNNFLYVGRLIERKGIEILVKAYQQYRRSVSKPWDLWLAGTGPFEEIIKNQPGIKCLGFVQPNQMPAVFKASTAFILPSYQEPWGVVVQEAAAAGLPLICSDACGAAVHLVRDQYNGFCFETGNSDHLSHCLKEISALSLSEWNDMSRRSFELSQQYTPLLWAKTLVEGLKYWGA